ncbi:MAG: ShlB/FhaC/HecB family hemolysin secretion/activation protein [Pelagibacterales bacterium]|nr:ShlB/FhaC/HecB family hemolysin secretion/activation protein [Pelagibacterales bacterium]
MKRIFTTVLLILLFNCSFAMAQGDNIDLQNQAIQSQRQFDRAMEQKAELRQLEKDRIEFESLEKEEVEKELSQNDGKVIQNLSQIQCFRISQIRFSANKILSNRQAKSLTESYLGKCLTISQVSEIGKKVGDYLVNKGFLTSRVEIPAQTLESGVLQINIHETYLEKITFNDDGFFDKSQKIFVFGFDDEKEILNIEKIDRGIDQINRLGSNNAVAKILPGNMENSSIVAIENNPQKRTRVNLSYDSKGSDISGRYKNTIALSQDNLFHINDNFNISKTGNNFDSHRKTNRSDSLNSNFSVPFGRHILSLNYSKSSYFFRSGNDNFSKSDGHTSTSFAALNSNIIKSKRLKINSNFDITRRYNQNFSNDQKIDASSRKASIASFSIVNSAFFNNSSLYLKPTYSKSINLLDARKDPKTIAAKDAHAEFEMFKLHANYSRKLTIPYLENSVYNLSFDSQLSKQKLYGIDQFSVGGFYTVRGLRNGSISNDSGYNIKNEITFNLRKVSDLLVKEEYLGSFANVVNYISITPFYDYGFVKSSYGKDSGRVSSSGFSAGFDNSKFTTSLTCAWVLSKSQYLLDNRKENMAIYFDIGTQFGFF